MTLREDLGKKGAVYGLFSKTRDPMFVQAMGNAGLDFVILDDEHGPDRDLYPLVLAARESKIHPIIRVSSLDQTKIQKALDFGISGIQVPQIQSAQDVLQLKRFARFHPHGERGVCRFVSAAQYGLLDKKEYFRQQNDVVTIGHIEGETGAANLPSILDADGLDVVFIGPYDLSQSMGLPGQIDHQKVLGKIEEIVGQCKEKGKYVGIFTETPESAQMYQKMGVKYISYHTDVGLFAATCRGLAEKLKS